MFSDFFPTPGEKTRLNQSPVETAPKHRAHVKSGALLIAHRFEQIIVCSANLVSAR